MAHLESKQIVHRDLAARNVLGMCCDATLLSFTLSFTLVSHHLMLSYKHSTFVIIVVIFTRYCCLLSLPIFEVQVLQFLGHQIS